MAPVHGLWKVGQGTVGAACMAPPLLLPPLPLLEPPDFGWRLLRLPERLVLEVAPPDSPLGPLPPPEPPERCCGAGAEGRPAAAARRAVEGGAHDDLLE